MTELKRDRRADDFALPLERHLEVARECVPVLEGLEKGVQSERSASVFCRNDYAQRSTRGGHATYHATISAGIDGAGHRGMTTMPNFGIKFCDFRQYFEEDPAPFA